MAGGRWTGGAHALRATAARRRWAAVTVVATLLAGTPAGRANAQLPTGVRLDDVGSFTFDEREGLPASTIFDVFRFRDGEMWLGSLAGAYRKAGDRWIAVPPPAPLTVAQVRMLAEAPDGTKWFAGRHEVYRLGGTGGRVYRAADGLPRAPIYSVAVTTALDGEHAVVVGTAAGLYRLLDGDRFGPVPLPAGFDPAGLMLAVRDEGDGTQSLWAASIRAGIARLQRGVWRVWGQRDGLHPVVENVSTGASDDSVEAVAATYSGAYLFVGGRWRAITAPGVPINRALRVRTGGRYETWLGTFGGRVLREVPGGGWDTLTTSEPWATTPVVAFRVLHERVGDATVYAGFRGGSLTRLRTGRGSRVVRSGEALSRYVTAAAELPVAGGGTELALFRVGVGMQRTSRPSAEAFAEPVDVFEYVVNSIADGRPHGDDLWIGTHQGAYRWAGSRWERDRGLPLPTALSRVVIGPVPGGRLGVVRGTGGAPLMYRHRGAWLRFPGAPPSPATLLTADTVSGSPTLLVQGDAALHRYDGRTNRWSRLVGLAPLQLTALTAARVTRNAAGEELLWVSSMTHGIGWRPLAGGDSNWRWINTTRHLAFPSNTVSALVAAPNGQLVAGTDHGLVVLRPGRTARDSVAVDDVYLASDGLPHELVTALTLSADGRRVWVGTIEGLGAVEIASPRASPGEEPSRLIVQARPAEGRGAQLAGGETIAWRDRSVVMDVWLRSGHREAASRYRVEVDDERVASTAWSHQRSVSLPAMSAGRHQVRVWGMDWRGAVSGPVILAFRVAPPLWRSPMALVVYAVGLGAVVILGDRWRQAALRRRASVLEASERRLSASELRFRRLFEDGPDAQLLVRDGIVVDANPASLSLLGARTREQLVGRPLATIVLSNLPLQDGRRERDTSALVETAARGMTADEIPVAARRIAIAVPGDPIECVELHDRRPERRLEAERALLEHQLREAQRLESLGNLAGGVAHDFNNLLTIIQGHARLLRNAALPSAHDRDSVTSILQATERARSIVQQILTFSRRSEPLRVPVALGELVREVMGMLRASIPATVELAIDDRTNGAQMIGDPTSLHQLLINLAANAEHAMRATGGGRLAIALEVVPAAHGGGRRHGAATSPARGADASEHPTRVDGGGKGPCMDRALRLTVSDTGVGMPAAVVARIFEPFFTTKPAGEGTGLGLAVLHGIVTSHDGTVEVSSTPGVGTTFTIHFPLLEGATPSGSAKERTPSRRTPAISASRESILVVDDEEAVADVTALLLEEAGYRVTRRYSPNDALDLLTGGARVDLVITDQTMPGMTGITLAGRLHSMQPALPIIIATGFGKALRASELAQAGVRRVLEKPFMEDELLSAVSEALRTRSN